MRETFLPATIPSSLSSKLVSGTRVPSLEWNNSHRVGLEFWEEVGIVHLPVSPVAAGQACPGGAVGLGLLLPSVLTGCIGSRVRGGVGHKSQSGMTWARLISSLNWGHQKGLSLSLFLLLLNTLKATFRRCLWGGYGALL